MRVSEKRFAGGEEASASMKREALLTLYSQLFKTTQRILVSKALFETTKHSMEVSVRPAGTARAHSVSSHFPDIVAQHNQLHEEKHGQETNARFFTSNPQIVMTARQHLPTYETVCADAELFRGEYSSRTESDGPATEDYEYGRPQLVRVPEEGSSCEVALEAEFDQPIPFSDTTEFVFSIQGRAGTDGSVKSSVVVTGKQLVAASNANFALRKRLLRLLSVKQREVGSEGEVSIQPHPLLYARSAFQFDEEAGEIAQRVTEEGVAEEEGMGLIPIDGAKLITFQMAWLTPKRGHRTLGLVSACVAFHFRRPRPDDAKAEPEMCCACFTDVMSNDKWSCGRCGKSMHPKCLDMWKAMCLRQDCPTSCPLCRAEL